MPTNHVSRWLVPTLAGMMLQCRSADLTVTVDDGASGSITPIAAMSAPRAAHTATTLADGRVLVLGGFARDDNTDASAEAYDPATGRFAPLRRMVLVRHSHTATVLENGKVLIVGGYAAGNEVVAHAELFDPTTNLFSATGSMYSARAGHVAALLPDGKVLVAGGVGPGWTFLSSAEVYDPATGRFSRTGDMTVARESHVAVGLPDGRVFVVGGHRGRRAEITLYSSAETYDAASRTFRRVGDMRTRRHKHDAVLLRDGSVLISGGSDERDDRGAYTTTELFDPATGRFSPGPSMRRSRYKHAGSSVLLPNGAVLIAGGAGVAEILRPQEGTAELVGGAARLAGQFSAVAPLPNGAVLITGGYGNGTGPRNSAWVYRP